MSDQNPSRTDVIYYVNRFAFWLLIIAIALFTLGPFFYAVSISFRTNNQATQEARYLPESKNFTRQFVSNFPNSTVNITDIVDAGNFNQEYIEIENISSEDVNLNGWVISNRQNDDIENFEFGNVTLEPDQNFRLYTGTDRNASSPTTTGWELSEAIWEDGNEAALATGENNAQSIYVVGGQIFATRNYTGLLDNSDFLRSLLNSAVVSSVTVILALIVGAFAAYALGRVQFRGKLVILYLVLAMTMFPQISVLSGLFRIVKDLGIDGSLIALVFTYPIFTLPFTVWVLTSFFQGLPDEIEQAALVDGATTFQTFYMILIPLTAPALATTGLLAFIAAWNEYLFALTFTLTNPSAQTVPPQIANFSGLSFEEPFTDRIAGAVVVTIPLLVLVLIFQRRIVEGLTAGAVKG